MLQPKKFTHPKVQTGRLRVTQRASRPHFGVHSLVMTESGRVTARHIEAVRRVLSRTMNRQGKVWFRAFPDTPVSDKPLEARMGKGKGATEYWCTRLPAGSSLFEISGVNPEVAGEAIRKASKKLPVTSRLRNRTLPLL